MNPYLILGALAVLAVACTAPKQAKLNAPPIAIGAPPAPFAGSLTPYWYGGKAEVTTYDLRQARYGEYRDGTAVLIQVTEDFLTEEQVKNDTYTNPNSVPIIKTNLIRRFTTGVYDYSVMSSVFTPTEVGMPTLKVTTSSQDWCGQSYTQLNNLGRYRWKMQLRSYFESEGDQDRDLTADFLEDELFNRIRIGGQLPTGSFRVVPATAYLLLTHQPYTAAEATITETTNVDGRRQYTIHYTELERQLTITHETAAPFRIVSWTETYPDRGELMTTVATLRERDQLPYWQLNAKADDSLRDDLGLK